MRKSPRALAQAVPPAVATFSLFAVEDRGTVPFSGVRNKPIVLFPP